MRFRVSLTILAFLLTGSAAPALTLDLDDCDAFGCEGSSVFLTVTDAGSGDWNVTLGLDSTGYSGDLDGVVQAGFKAIQGASDVTLVSFSDGSWADAKFAGINSNGLCSGPGEPGFGCTSGYANILSDDVYTWDFFVEGGTLLAISDWTIKFQYCDQGDETCRGHIISAPGSAVPEPSAALVFAAGLLAAAPYLRRRG